MFHRKSGPACTSCGAKKRMKYKGHFYVCRSCGNHTSTEKDGPSQWTATTWEVISTVILLAFDLTPFAALLFGGTSKGWLIVTGFLILSFWPSSVAVAVQALKEKKLPEITGGPGVSWAGRTYGPGYGRRH